MSDFSTYVSISRDEMADMLHNNDEQAAYVIDALAQVSDPANLAEFAGHCDGDPKITAEWLEELAQAFRVAHGN